MALSKKYAEAWDVTSSETDEGDPDLAIDTTSMSNWENDDINHDTKPDPVLESFQEKNRENKCIFSSQKVNSK